MVQCFFSNKSNICFVVVLTISAPRENAFMFSFRSSIYFFTTFWLLEFSISKTMVSYLSKLIFIYPRFTIGGTRKKYHRSLAVKLSLWPHVIETLSHYHGIIRLSRKDIWFKFIVYPFLAVFLWIKFHVAWTFETLFLEFPSFVPVV